MPVALALDGKVCVVTGASRGLGRAIAVRMSQEGCNVVINYYSHKREAEETNLMIKRNKPEALVVRADVSKKSDVELLAQQVIKTFGTVDILVNNAGMFMVKPSLELAEEEWDRTIDINLKGTFLCSQIVGKTMVERRRGVIINMSSIAGLTAFPKRAAYCAAKAGIVALTKTLAAEWAEYNVRVNAVAPAYVETEKMKQQALEGTLDASKIIQRTPMKRLGEPREVAAAVAFLASDEASYITGEILAIDGGWLSYGYV